MIVEVGLLSLLWLVAIVYALIHILQSSAGTGAKVLWSVLVLIIQPIGVII